MNETALPGRGPGSTVNVLALGSFVRDLGQYIVWVIMSVYLNETRNVGYIDIGLIFLVGGIISIPVSIYGGNVMDRIGRRKMAVLMPWLLVIIYSTLFLLVHQGYSTFFISVLFIVSTPIQSLQYVAMESIVSDVTSSNERINAFGLLRITANVGIGVGLVTGGFLSQINYSLVFLLPVAGSVIEGMLYFLRIPETSRVIHRERTEVAHSLNLLLPFRDRLFITVSLVVSFAWFITGMFESPLTPLYLSSSGNYENLAITGLFAVNTVIVIVTQGPVNRLLNRYRDSSRIVLGVILFGAGYLLFSSTLDYLFLIIAVVILTTGENIGAPASSALITKMAPEDRRGSYLGSYSAINSLINPFRPMVATTLLALNSVSPDRVWLILAFFSLGTASVLFAIFRRAYLSMKDRTAN